MGWIKGLMSMVLLLPVCRVHAQGRTKTMLEQVAALQGYIRTVEKGYQLAEEGVALVRDIKSGEFDLHRVFFGSLERVDKGVAESPILAEAWVYAVLVGDQAAKDALRVLTTAKAFTMTDGERLRQIERIRNELKEEYGQLRRINAVRAWLGVQQKKEESYLQTLKKIYGLQ